MGAEGELTLQSAPTFPKQILLTAGVFTSHTFFGHANIQNVNYGPLTACLRSDFYIDFLTNYFPAERLSDRLFYKSNVLAFFAIY